MAGTATTGSSILRSAIAVALLVACACGYADPLDDFLGLRKKGRIHEALEVLRGALRDPGFTRNVPRSIEARRQFLQALGEHTGSVGPHPRLDEEAHKVYQDGLQASAGGDDAAGLAEAMVAYYALSSRMGNTLPYMRLSLEHWQRTGQQYRLFNAFYQLSTVYWQMGEFELMRHYVNKAHELASRYFVRGPWPDNHTEWAGYWLFLLAQLDLTAELGDAREIERLEKLLDPVELVFRGGTVAAVSKFTLAYAFAMSGQTERARDLFAKATLLWKDARPRAQAADQRFGDGMHLCIGGMTQAMLKDYSEAVESMESCLSKYGSARSGMLSRHAVVRQILGHAYEGSSRFDDAIAAYRFSIREAEAIRSSYSVAERARFFRTRLRLPYWGVVRILARQGAGDEAAFFEALHTAELVRGRQLGEIIDPEMSKGISPERLRSIRAGLPTDTLVLSYTATDSEIILLAMTRERLLASVAPLDGRAFATLARAGANVLARPTSPRAEAERQLLELSKPLLATARPLLAGKKRIYVLPDGAMNLIPFELLSASEEAYRPLIEDYVVITSPSLAFMGRAALRSISDADLMALGDANYAEPKSYGGASAEEVREATRGGRHLSYFAPLPETRDEVESIAKLFAGRKVDLLLGPQAVKSRLKAIDLSKYGFLHFATHGILGNEVPGIGEPALVLGRESGESGFLTASEVNAMRLDAQLAVLSACNTGSGEFVTGEGVMGMGRAFLAAGSRGVVVSLWRVASKQTEQLMVDFYRHLKAGKPAADALRDAKLSMIEQARRTRGLESHPYYWAPFILLGN